MANCVSLSFSSLSLSSSSISFSKTLSKSASTLGPQALPHCQKLHSRTLSVRAQAVTLPVLTFDGERAGEASLDLKCARPDTARAVVHRGVITELQNRRRGTASTLTRAEVRGGGRKPYRQKGTGRARRGSQRTPLRPGGGVIFGPKPKDWSIKMNKKEKRLAISTALMSATVSTVVVEDFNDKFERPKTKEFIEALKRWGVEPSEHTLIFSTEVSENVRLSSRNIGTLKVLTPRNLNLYDVLRADKLVFTEGSVDYLNRMYGLSSPDAEEDESRLQVLDNQRCQGSHALYGEQMSPCWSQMLPPRCLGVTGGDHVSRFAMENMIYTVRMINMSIDGSPTTSLIFQPAQINQGSSHSNNLEYGA